MELGACLGACGLVGGFKSMLDYLQYLPFPKHDACCLASFLQTQNRAAYYPPSQIAQLRPSPRWTAQGARPHRKSFVLLFIKLGFGLNIRNTNK